jgi:hypothetical protein
MRNPEEGRATKNDVLSHLQIVCSKMVHGVLVSISYNFYCRHSGPSWDGSFIFQDTASPSTEVFT